VRADRLLLIALGLMLTACATPMAMRDIQAIKPNCARIDRQIAALEREKAENDQRLIAGIQSVYPALAVLSLMRGTYSQNVSIATGEWAAGIDRKLAELRRTKKSC
jgi:hypothetical protein